MEDLKHVVDVAAFGASVAALAGWLPVAAAAVSIIWTIIRIYETKTVQAWVSRKDLK